MRRIRKLSKGGVAEKTGSIPFLRISVHTNRDLNSILNRSPLFVSIHLSLMGFFLVVLQATSAVEYPYTFRFER